MKSILFVCHGNICRSPMGEYIFKYISGGKYKVESRSTSTDEIGNDIYPPVKEVLNKYNIPYTKHQATQITLDDYNSFDYILCFDERNMTNLRRMFSDVSKIEKLLDYDIDDPWYTREFDRCFHETLEGCKKLLERIESEENEI